MVGRSSTAEPRRPKATLQAVASLAAKINTSIIRTHTLEGTDEPWIETDLNAEVTALQDAFEQLDQRIPEAETQLASLELLLKTQKEADSFDQYLRAGELVGASVSLREMMLSLSDIIAASSAIVDPPILEIVQAECIDRKASLLCQLSEVVKAAYTLRDPQTTKAAFVVSQRTVATNSFSFHANPVSIDDLLLALDTVGMLEIHMLRLAKQFVESFVFGRNGELCTSVLTVLVSFISEHVFSQSVRPPAQLASYFSTEIHKAIVRFSTSVLMDNLNESEMIDSLADHIRDFETYLDSKELWNAACAPLARYAGSLRQRQAAAESNKIMFDALQLVETLDNNIVAAPGIWDLGPLSAGKNTAVSGKQGKQAGVTTLQEFEMPACKVSQQMLVLAETVTERLGQIDLKSDPKLQESRESICFLQTTKNMIEMYRAKIVLSPEEMMQTVRSPSRAMTLFCDCMFMSQYLCMLGPQFLGTSKQVASLFTFSDLIPLFRQTGMSVLNEHLEHVFMQLQTDLKQALADGLQSEQAMHRLLASVNSIVREWKVSPIKSNEQSSP
eukprot:jgi/Hompol1/6412/HPOL_004971-RA